MDSTKQIFVIYRLKFKSENEFQSAVETMKIGQKFGEYLSSLQRSFLQRQSQRDLPIVTAAPEINLCKDDLVIYLCSDEIRQVQYGNEATAQGTPRLPYYYELLLEGTFGSFAELTVAVGERI